jgi:hypothetical protein
MALPSKTAFPPQSPLTTKEHQRATYFFSVAALVIMQRSRSFRYYSPKNLAEFSSLGPAFDGRMKPDIVAPGVNIMSANSDANMYAAELEYERQPPALSEMIPAGIRFSAAIHSKAATKAARSCQEHRWPRPSPPEPLRLPASASPLQTYTCCVVFRCMSLAFRYLREGWYPTGYPVAQHSINPSSALLRAIMMQVQARVTIRFDLRDCCHRARCL